MVEYQIDSATYSLTAGLQTTYMFTRAELGQDEIWELSGSFADATCPDADCPGSLTFYWRNNDTGNDFDSTWYTGEFPMYFKASDLISFQTHLGLEFNVENPTEVSWFINDSLYSSGKELTYLSNGEPFQVSVEILDSTGYVTKSSQLFLPEENMFCTRCIISAQVDTAFNLFVLPLSPGAHTFKWHTGDTTQFITVPLDPAETYSVTVTNTAGGCTASTSLSQLPTSFFLIRSANVEAVAMPFNPSLAGGPIVEWIDPQGIAWSSDRIAQQPFPANFFQILELEDYLENENGLSTRKLRVAWRCRVYNEAGASRTMSGEGVIGMGWPK